MRFPLNALSIGVFSHFGGVWAVIRCEAGFQYLVRLVRKNDQKREKSTVFWPGLVHWQGKFFVNFSRL